MDGLIVICLPLLPRFPFLLSGTYIHCRPRSVFMIVYIICLMVIQYRARLVGQDSWIRDGPLLEARGTKVWIQTMSRYFSGHHSVLNWVLEMANLRSLYFCTYSIQAFTHKPRNLNLCKYLLSQQAKCPPRLVSSLAYQNLPSSMYSTSYPSSFSSKPSTCLSPIP